MEQKEFTDRWHEAVADTLRAERAAHKLTQAELASKAGIPRITYIRYETGERRPSVVQLAQIANAFGVDFVELARRVRQRV